MKQWSLLILSLVLVACGGSGGGGSSTKAKPQFERLTTPSSVSAIPFHLSGDGSLAFGDAGAGRHPILWDASGLSSEFPSSTPLTMLAVSAVTREGRTFCGSAKRTDGTIVPVLYRSETQIDELPLPSGATSGNGAGISADGTVVLGADNAITYYDLTVSHRPFLVKSGVAAYLPVPEGATTIATRGLSGDGSTVIGTIDKRPVRWTNGGAPQILDGVEALAAGSPIYDIDMNSVSRDGSTIAGTVVLGSGLQTTGAIPFRWTVSGGVKAISGPSNITSVVRGISDDGKTVLLSGLPNGTSATVPYLWTEKTGAKAVSELFIQAGGDPTTFVGQQPTALSGNGKTIAGSAIHTEAGDAQAGNWKLTLP